MGKKKRDKKIGKAQFTELQTDVDMTQKQKEDQETVSSNTHNEQTEKVKEKKKKKKCKNTDESAVTETVEQMTDGAVESELVTKTRKKMKKKEKNGKITVVTDNDSCLNTEISGTNINGHSESNSTDKGCTDKSKESGEIGESSSNSEGVDQKKKKKKKKNGKELLETNQADLLQSNGSGIDVVNNEDNIKKIDDDPKENKKKNKRKFNEETNKLGNNKSAAPTPKKKKKGNKAGKETEKSVHGVAGKENENEGGSEEKETIDIGQWSSAAFENTERQEKFIRLLGGKKQKDKSFSGIQQKLFSIGMADIGDFKSGGGNTSMNWKQQNDYMKNMETEFERAKDTNFKKGRGFGFKKPPGEGKKFFIDVSKNKSKKFDD